MFGRRRLAAVGSAITSDDQRYDPLAVARMRDFLTDFAAATHDNGPVGDLNDVIHGVRDDDDRSTFVTEPFNEIEYAT
jgi:hypothetical protein